MSPAFLGMSQPASGWVLREENFWIGRLGILNVAMAFVLFYLFIALFNVLNF